MTGTERSLLQFNPRNHLVQSKTEDHLVWSHFDLTTPSREPNSPLVGEGDGGAAGESRERGGQSGGSCYKNMTMALRAAAEREGDKVGGGVTRICLSAGGTSILMVKGEGESGGSYYKRTSEC